jgi:4-hydroxy-tetrahydrodipicolinate synthase
MNVDTMAKLYELKNIKGVKDATGDLNRVSQQLKAMGNEFIQLTGNDDNALEFNKRGGVGAIGVTANVAAKLSSDFQKACANDIKKATELDKLLQPLHTSLFIESNPSPVKYAASLLGMCKPTVRLPLVEIREETKKKVSDALKVAKLL